MKSQPKKIMIFNFEQKDDFHGYQIKSFDFKSRFQISSGWGPFKYFREKWLQRSATYYAYSVDDLYRRRDSDYMRFINWFINEFSDCEIIMMNTFNPIHPEVFKRHFSNAIKILGFVDDPVSSYKVGISNLWAFDGAMHISPSYNERVSMSEALNDWGCQNTFWFPLCNISVKKAEDNQKFFSQRSNKLCYVGLASTLKLERLAILDREFGNDFVLHGRWPLAGYSGILKGLLNHQKVLWRKVKGISNEEREKLYFNTKIGLNMHVSELPAESGNMRMYELPAHGVLQVCDRAAKNLNESIFNSSEAVYYDNITDAIEKIKHYLEHDNERIEIARKGFQNIGHTTNLKTTYYV